MNSPATGDVRALIDDLPLRGPMLRVPLLCVLLMFVEGIDAFGLGFISPYLSKELGLSADQMGLIFTSTVIASLIGATMVAPLSDRLGRRKLLLWTSGMMIPATLLTAHVPSFEALFAIRFLIGICFGAALPAAIALVADYAPARRRSSLLMLLNAGIGGGVVLAGYCAAALIPVYGWHSLIYASTLISLVAAFLSWLWLPESLHFLVRAGRQDDALEVLRPLMGADTPAALVCEEQQGATRSSPGALFEAGMLATTVLLWALVSMTYVTVNFVSYWLPTVMLNAGADITLAGVAISTGKACGILGIFLIGWLADRYGLARTATTNFALTGALVLGIALSPTPAVAVVLLIAALGLDGANVSGGQAFLATSFPSHLRATAFGWVSGFARLVGGGIGTMLGARIVGAGWSFDRIALVMGCTFLVNAAIVQLLRLRTIAETPAPADIMPVAQACKG